MNTTLAEARIITLPKISDPRGNLTFIEGNGRHIPFDIKRAYWIYDVPGGEKRGGHAYRLNEEFIIALSGSFDVVLDDGSERRIYSLNRSYFGLYVPNMIWRQLENFSTNGVTLILASTFYSPDDYIRDYDAFVQQKREALENTLQEQAL
ncbi:MAG: FdtA/QdtA family cupin domain-containing protein [Bacteroidota bacterium]|nr:FdtA/QdtA family cupin domain-containing protein [Candidatus Kapabacteria bacterium]MDW8219579.1 FdtA/QdtA family cupin domain-containing protein [Bacteroidota bacterium]